MNRPNATVAARFYEAGLSNDASDACSFSRPTPNFRLACSAMPARSRGRAIRCQRYCAQVTELVRVWTGMDMEFTSGKSTRTAAVRYKLTTVFILG